MPTQSTPTRPHHLPPSYVAVWGLLAVISAGYLAVALAAPGLIGNPIYSSGSEFASNAPDRSTANTRHLKKRLSAAQLEIAKLRTELSQQNETAKRNTNQASLRDDKPVQMAQAPQVTQITKTPAVSSTSTTPVVPSVLNGSDTPTPAQVITTTLKPTSVGPQPKPTPTVAAQPANEAAIATALLQKKHQPASPITTGSINVPPPPTRAPPPPLNLTRTIAATPALGSVPIAKSVITQTIAKTPAPVAQAVKVATRAPNAEPAMGVRLATGPSLDALRLSWNQILARGGGTMSGLEPRFVTSNPPGSLGPTYDLIAGPLKSLSDAQRICDSASVRRSVCEIRRLEGTVM